MAIPEKPISRIEHYLARANGQNVQPPEPISRIEHYLSGIADLKSQMDEKAPAIMQTVSNQAIARFADGADDMPLKSLVAAINPVQAGTGDPSPENVRPITGWNAVCSYVRGVNWCDEEWEVGGFNYTTGDVTTETDRIRSKNFSTCLPSTQYYWNIPGQNLRILYYDANKEFITFDGWYETSRIVTTPPNAYFFKIGGSAAYGTTYNNDIGFNYPATDKEYHPYQGADYTADLGQTVYGGTLDVVRGVLTVTMAEVDLGTLTWSKSNSVLNGFVATEGMPTDFPIAPSTDAVPHWLNSKGYDVVANKALDVEGDKQIAWRVSGTSKGVIVRDSAYSSIYDPFDAAAFKAAMNGVQLVYELATPKTYQLTPVEVKTLLGQNNIFADTGNVTVIYPADTKTYIDNQMATLQALVLENISNS